MEGLHSVGMLRLGAFAGVRVFSIAPLAVSLQFGGVAVAAIGVTHVDAHELGRTGRALLRAEEARQLPAQGANNFHHDHCGAISVRKTRLFPSGDFVLSLVE